MVEEAEARRFQRSGTLQSWNLHVTRCSEGSQRAGSREADSVQVSSNHVITDNGLMHSMPRRETLLRCQTPQCFRLPVITRAHELAAADPDFAPTDDCGVVLRYLPDVNVHIVQGSERNIKITYPQDLVVAEALLSR